MVNGKYLIDTNIVIAFLSGDRDVYSKLESVEEVYISVVVLGELLYGAKNSRNVEENVKMILQFVEQCILLPIDGMTAEYYSDVKVSPKERGRPIPENDIWIAATAIQYGLTLSSRDDHFKLVDNIILEKW